MFRFLGKIELKSDVREEPRVTSTYHSLILEHGGMVKKVCIENGDGDYVHPMEAFMPLEYGFVCSPNFPEGYKPVDIDYEFFLQSKVNPNRHEFVKFHSLNGNSSFAAYEFRRKMCNENLYLVIKQEIPDYRIKPSWILAWWPRYQTKRISLCTSMYTFK